MYYVVAKGTGAQWSEGRPDEIIRKPSINTLGCSSPEIRRHAPRRVTSLAFGKAKNTSPQMYIYIEMVGHNPRPHPSSPSVNDGDNMLEESSG